MTFVAAVTWASAWAVIWKVAVALLVIAFMILTHELGHYFAAKAVGIKVDQFSLGFGPEIVGWTRGETRYSLKWIFAGGSVKIAGMNPEEEISPEDLPRTYYEAPPWKRAIVILAGSAVHIFIALILFYLVFWPVGYQALTGKVAEVAETFSVGSSLSPSEAHVDGSSFVLTVRGDNFVRGSEVQWDTRKLSTSYISDKTLKAQVPSSLISHSGTVEITVINPSGGGVVSNAQAFLVREALPVLTSITPSRGSTGDTVTITGKHFGSRHADSAVTFNSIEATSYSMWSDSQIRVKVPAGATTGPVLVSTGSGLSNEVPFVVTNTIPSLQSISPGQVVVGNSSFTMMVSGDNFTHDSVIKWNDRSLTTEYVSRLTLKARIPASLVDQPGLVEVAVTNQGPELSTSRSITFLVNKPSPLLTSIAPNNGLYGDIIIIKGARFGSKQGSSFVLFNNIAAEDQDYVSWSDTEIRVRIPVGATTGPVSVSTNAGSSNEVDFQVTNFVPRGLALSPQQAKAGGRSFVLKVSGEDFVSNSVVEWDGTELVTERVSDTVLAARVPASLIAKPGAARVTVMNPGSTGGESEARTFNIRKSVGPVISVLSTEAGPAYTAGLRRGDLITSVDGIPVKDWEDLSEQLSNRPGQVVALVYDRGDDVRTTHSTRTTLLNVNGRGILAIQVDTSSTYIQKSNPIAAVGQAFKALGEVTIAFFKGIASLFSLTTLKMLVGIMPRSVDGPRSVVGAAQLTFQAAEQGYAYLLFILGELFLFLAIFNLLPLPPLDGGHLLVIVVEKVFHKEIDMKTFAKVAWVVIIVLSIIALRLALLDIFSPLKSPF